MPARRIDFYLNASDGLRSLTQEARRIAELDQILVHSAPADLTHACRVKQLRDGTLILLAENAAVAAKLKQLTARLLAAYRKQRSEVTSIRIEVQVNKAPETVAAKRQPRALSVDSIESLTKLAESLEESPLKQALTKLAGRQRLQK